MSDGQSFSFDIPTPAEIFNINAVQLSSVNYMARNIIKGLRRTPEEKWNKGVIMNPEAYVVGNDFNETMKYHLIKMFEEKMWELVFLGRSFDIAIAPISKSTNLK